MCRLSGTVKLKINSIKHTGVGFRGVQLGQGGPPHLTTDTVRQPRACPWQPATTSVLTVLTSEAILPRKPTEAIIAPRLF